jgi:hypothetical protein
MEFKSESYMVTPEIFKRKTEGDFTKPITLDFTSVTTGVVKAGSPISAAGVVANTADAIGILVDDVYAENPNGTICYHGILNLENCEANSGLTISAAAKTALKLVIFE